MSAAVPEPGLRSGRDSRAGGMPAGSGAAAWLDFASARPAAKPGVAEVIEAGFTHGEQSRLGPVRGRTGFEAGGHADALPPGSVLAELTGQARDRMTELSDDELVGVLRAARRVSSWQAAVELEAVAELAARRQAERKRPGPRPAERAAAELAAALTLTSPAADQLISLASGMERLDAVRDGLARGDIDLPRARVFADELAQLTWLQASVIAARMMLSATGMTTAQLRARLRREVLAADPQAVRRRQREARRDARIEAWQETSGNASIAGRELPPAEALAADRHLTALARALQAAGLPGNLDQARASVFLALLSGKSPESLLHAPGWPAAEHPADPQEQPDTGGALAWPQGPRGSIHLTMPLSAWLGQSDMPGEIAGHGPADAWACREIAAGLAGQPGMRCCLTITNPDGHPLGHACTRTPPPGPQSSAAAPPTTSAAPRAGPAPPAGPPAGLPAGQSDSSAVVSAWLGSLTVDWLDGGPCDHSLEIPRYRPSAKLAHLTRIRHPECTAPGCRRPAQSCDLDHVQPYLKGGRTCTCNLHPGCRRHHQMKQQPGWRVEMLKPGVLVWHLPHGRSYTTIAEPYPV